MSRDIGRSNPRAAGHILVSIPSRDAASMADKIFVGARRLLVVAPIDASSSSTDITENTS
jgi:hypothetical protein